LRIFQNRSRFFGVVRFHRVDRAAGLARRLGRAVARLRHRRRAGTVGRRTHPIRDQVRDLLFPIHVAVGVKLDEEDGVGPLGQHPHDALELGRVGRRPRSTSSITSTAAGSWSRIGATSSIASSGSS